MNRGFPLGAWLRLFRLSNAPTVASNVLAGAAVGMHARLAGSEVPSWAVARCCAGALLAYAAGMALNDAFDARTDARERPGRPIPSGRISPVQAMAAGFALLAGGTALLALEGAGTALPAAALAACIVAYDAAHRFLPGAFLLMAACRALVPFIAARAISPGADSAILWWVAGGSFAYVAAVTVAARNEVRGFGASARAATVLLLPAACAPLGIWAAAGVAPEDAVLATAGIGSVAFAVACVAAGMRTASSGAMRWSVPAAVGTWLGAIPAIDAGTCFLLGRPGLGIACLGLWGLAAAMRPRIAAS